MEMSPARARDPEAPVEQAGTVEARGGCVTWTLPAYTVEGMEREDVVAACVTLGAGHFFMLTLMRLEKAGGVVMLSNQSENSLMIEGTMKVRGIEKEISREMDPKDESGAEIIMVPKLFSSAKELGWSCT